MNPDRAVARAGEHMASHLRKVARLARNAAGLVIPTLDADPDPIDPTNVWLFVGPDYRMHVRFSDGVVRQIATVASTGATSTTPLPVVADPVLATVTYAATWAAGYTPTQVVGPVLSYGPDPSSLAQRRVMIGFADATIRADLAGAVVRRVELLMTNTNAYPDQVLVTFGAHNRASASATFAPVRADVWAGIWPRVGDGGWRDIPVQVGEWLRDNVAKGLTIDSPASLAYSGEMDWASVRLRITYTV